MPKFTLDSEMVQSHVVRQLESWVNSMPPAAQDTPFVTTAEGDVPLSPREILRNVQEGTHLGVQLMEHAAALALSDSLSNNWPGIFRPLAKVRRHS